MMHHVTRHAMMTKATTAATPTPALKAVVCVAGLLESRICWPVWLDSLPSPVVDVEGELVVDALLAALDVVMLEDLEVEAEAMDDGMLLEALLTALEVIDTVDNIETVVESTETVGIAETVADGDCAAEFVATDPVLVCCSPTTPMIVCAVPSETWNVPFPVLQSHIPSTLSG
jgi:hypothetical protein